MHRYFQLAIAACLLAGLVIVPAVKADTSQRVNTTTLTAVVHGAQTKIWLHNVRHAHSTSTTCQFKDVRGEVPHRFGTAWTCLTRVYRYSNRTGRLATVKTRTLLGPRYEGGLYEDGSGWRPYPKEPLSKRRARSVYMNVIWVHP